MITISPSSEKKKSHTMGIRLDENTFSILERFSKEMNMKKGKLLKLAFGSWVKMRLAIQEESMLLVSKTLFKQLIENIPNKKIAEIAQMVAENILNKAKIHLIDEGLEFSVKAFIDQFTYMFSTKGTGWFDSLKYQLLADNKITIYGMHSLNKKYSIFIRDLMEYLMKRAFNYELINASEEDISNTTVFLNFKLKG